MRPLFLSHFLTNVGQIEYMILDIDTNQNMKNLPLIFCFSTMSEFSTMLSEKFSHHSFGRF